MSTTAAAAANAQKKDDAPRASDNQHKKPSAFRSILAGATAGAVEIGKSALAIIVYLL